MEYSRQSISKKDIRLVSKALQQDLITTGNSVPLFEKKISKFVGSKFAVATNSATSALHISCMALDLKKSDYLWTSCNTFVASANCGVYCGAKIDLVDINPDDYNLSIDYLKKKLQKAKREKKLPKIIIPVHFSGHPCEMEEIKKLSRFYNFRIIEDASHALGAKYKGSKIGSCKYSDITVFSFHPTKIITTIEGGMACTNNKNVYDRLKSLREHGIERKKFLYKKKYFLNYQQNSIGYNYRMNDIQATLGISQLSRIKLFYKKRLAIKNFYIKKLRNKLVTLPSYKKHIISSYHLFVIRIKSIKNIFKRDLIFKKLRKKNINVNIHYIPIHFHEFYRKFFINKNFVESEKYYSEALSLPIHPDLKTKEIKIVVKEINKFL
jgi:UDP-4-amino-4,6-dideoxy-N-acetyl-beta-L-altrosamine transaminase